MWPSFYMMCKINVFEARVHTRIMERETGIYLVWPSKNIEKTFRLTSDTGELRAS